MILTWENGLAKAETVNKIIKEKYPSLNFKCQDIDHKGKNINFNLINNFNPDILLVGVGAPYQDILIHHNLKKMPSVKLAIGVGGSFDYISNKTKKAPKSWCTHGLEWLYRLIYHPEQRIKRFKRILNAWPRFPWKIYTNSLK
jgi:N-acetylglucosaminyldiphosphoundecaprenol N-acetyl-beta-D-mannosaminyltransferase